MSKKEVEQLGDCPRQLLSDVRALIAHARTGVAVAVNSGIVTMYWAIGRRISLEILKKRRAEYGEAIVRSLSLKLAPEYGEGVSEKNLRHMIRFYEVFQDEKIVSALRRQLSWTHFKALIYIKDALKRDFYSEMCRIENWNTRTLERKIAGMLYERTALSRKPAKLAELELRKLKEEDTLTPDLVFRDPYFLDFLGLKGAYQEKDLEAAILREMEAFILELGAGFTFVARQKRMQVGPDDFYLDLLFFHRKLRRLVAIELKFDKFKPEFKGQMELYLRWLNKYERQPHEEIPIGLILCAGKSEEQVELLELDKSGIKVAEYLTELPSRSALETRLHQAIAHARERLLTRERPEKGK